MDKAVSVIIPVYNGEKYIKRCLESIQNQTLENIEIIIVNDGSTDDTLSILTLVNDKRLTVISQENRGQGFARNAGLDAAAGEYIAFVDADDTIDKNMLLCMYNKAKETNSDVVQCNILDIYGSDTKIQLTSSDETVEITDKGKYTDMYFTPCRHSYEVCNKLIKRSIIDKFNLRFHDTHRIFSEDLMFNLELISCIKVISFISKPYYNYYISEAGHLRCDAEKRLLGICRLFGDYMKGCDKVMREAVSYTAAMIIIYYVGFCSSAAAENVLKEKETKRYIRAALKRKCKFKHRIFLIAIRISPVKIKKCLAKIYAGRWQI